MFPLPQLRHEFGDISCAQSPWICLIGGLALLVSLYFLVRALRNK